MMRYQWWWWQLFFHTGIMVYSGSEIKINSMASKTMLKRDRQIHQKDQNHQNHQMHLLCIHCWVEPSLLLSSCFNEAMRLKVAAPWSWCGRKKSNNTKWQKEKLLATTTMRKTGTRTTRRRRRATTMTRRRRRTKPTTTWANFLRFIANSVSQF